jgi:hypothetical protein
LSKKILLIRNGTDTGRLYRRLQKACHHGGPHVSNMWGRLAPSTGWPANGPHMLAPPRYIGLHRLKDQIYAVLLSRFYPRD